MAIRGSALAGVTIPVGGPAGLPGQSTYAAWLALGNTGALADFVAAQKGAPGGVTTLAGKAGVLSLDDVGAVSLAGGGVGFNVAATGGVSRPLPDALGVAASIFTYLSPAQIADVLSGNATLDLAPTLNAILNTQLPLVPLTLRFPAGVYGVAAELLIQMRRINIVLEAGAVIRQISGFIAGPRARGIFHFLPASAGSSLTGKGTIDGNRANLINAYLALPKSVQSNGLYVMEQQWDGVLVEATDDITIDGITIVNAMSVAIWHAAGRRFRGTNLVIRDSTTAIASQSGDDAVWDSISEVNIGNVVNGVAIPWWAYANAWADLNRAKISNISINGYTFLSLDGTAAAPGTRIGDPYGGYFMFQRLFGGSITGLTADGFAGLIDGRASNAIWGVACDNLSHIPITGLSIKGAYWSLQISGSRLLAVTNFILDGLYNTAAVAGAGGAAGIWLVPTGQLKGNGTLTSAFDHNSMQPNRGLTIANGTVLRTNAGVVCYTGGVFFDCVRSLAHLGPGWVFWANFVSPMYPGSAPFPVRGIHLLNTEAAYCGSAGYQWNDGVDIRAVNPVSHNNGQESATTFVASAFHFTPGFGGVKKRIFLVAFDARDTQAEAIGAQFSFVPGSTTGNVYKLVATRSDQIAIGQRVLVKNGGGAGVDLNVKITDIDQDIVTVRTNAPATFSTAACTTALAGTVSVPAGSNLLTGVGTAFISAIKGPAFILAGGQYLKVGQVISDTQLQLDTFAGAPISGAAASQVLAAIQGIPSQVYGVYAPADPNISDISLGDPSSYIAQGNTVADVLIAPASEYNDYTNYTPAFAASGGSSVTLVGGGSFKKVGKTLFVRGYVQVTSGTPTSVTFTLPNGLTAFGGGAISGFNANSGVALSGQTNGANAVTLRPVGGALVSAANDYLQYSGQLQVA